MRDCRKISIQSPGKSKTCFRIEARPRLWNEMEEYTGTESTTIYSLSKERRRSRTKDENPSFMETARLRNVSGGLKAALAAWRQIITEGRDALRALTQT